MSIKVGVIGVGLAGTAHVKTLNDSVAGADVVAVADIDLGRCHAVAATCPGQVEVFGDAYELIRSDLVEAVVITSIAETHAGLVLACIAEGKPVFCEKPLAVTAEDCQRILDAEAAAGRKLVQVGFMRRFDTGYMNLKAAVDADAVGAPVAVHCVHRNASVPESFTSPMTTTEALIHEIDIIRWLTGQEIVEVLVHRNPVLAGGEKLIDPQFFTLTTERGIHIAAEVFVNARYGYEIRCEVIGETGTAELPQPASVTINAGGKRSNALDADFRTRFAQAYRDELVVWIQGVEAGTVLGPDSWDGYAATAVSEACVASLNSGQTESVSLAGQPAIYA